MNLAAWDKSRMDIQSKFRNQELLVLTGNVEKLDRRKQLELLSIAERGVQRLIEEDSLCNAAKSLYRERHVPLIEEWKKGAPC